ncbi:GNAT family N-acetyltransferase [Brunnivagina elsteri]|uniref:GNAT family N-acetyltransferase n=1 Tax=Brunnivagina elsteri CCALA 953 TaxID=987040 RepID=A0A2A2TDK9_9CYAN|nr:GNAT family N-acetyltransferase [Calothrix elsteri]PAX51803.1 GNAT family N-acetyltransferase [Calothrix elsteri CCALA 953]
MNKYYKDFLIRSWEAKDRQSAAELIRGVLAEYGLGWEADGADRDVVQVEECYLDTAGEFWVIEYQNIVVGTGAYYPIERGQNAVKIRKMYFLPQIRGFGLGKYLLQQLEEAMSCDKPLRVYASRGFQEIWIETASILKEAVQMYEKNGYLPATGIETLRCDRVYFKKVNY